MGNEIQRAQPSTGQLMPRSLFSEMAERYGMEKEAFEATLMKTIMPGGVGKEHVAAFLIVAKQYELNPFTREIFAFPAKGGGIQPVVSIDGWMKILNANPMYDGLEFHDHIEEGKLVAVTCRIYHKQRTHPISITEYLDECRRNTDTWRQWPARMLRHKAVIQCARYAFGFAGIIDEDEYERLGAHPTAVAQDAQPIGTGVQGLRRAVQRQPDPDPVQATDADPNQQDKPEVTPPDAPTTSTENVQAPVKEEAQPQTGKRQRPPRIDAVE